MNHKLFHTLVLSGVALVEGCASTQGTTREVSNGSSTPATNESSASSTSGSSASPTNNVATTTGTGDQVAAPQNTAPPTGGGGARANATADEVRAMVADARSCRELGWATTKSQTLTIPDATIVTVEGTQYACRPRSTNQAPRCCHGWVRTSTP